MKKAAVFLSICLLVVSGCKEKKDPIASITDQETTTDLSSEKENTSTMPASLVQEIEKVHGKSMFLSQSAVAFDINLEFGGKPRLDARIFMSTDSKYVKIEHADGNMVFYDGNKVWFTGGPGNDQSARFDILTWSYFFALPFKISDPGTNIKMINDTAAHEVLELTFGDTIGDSPDDWYHLYIDKEFRRIDYAGYIVTFGNVDKNDAEKNAHAIGYEKFETIDGVQLATSWSFYNYDNEVKTETTIRAAAISNIEFGTFNDTFQVPEGAHEVTMD